MTLRRQRPAATAAFVCCLAAACTSTSPGPRDPLDAAEWRSAKSRMYVDLARQCLRAEDHVRARRLLQEAVQFGGNDRPTLELLARLAYTQGDLDTAAVAAAALQRIDPDSVAAWCTLGAIAEARDDHVGAERCYRSALAAAPDEARPAIDLHRLLLAQSRDAEATTLRGQLQLSALPAARLDHGAHLAAAGRWHDASEAFDRALQARPGDAAAANGFALCAVLGARPEAAVALGERLPPHARGDNPSLALTLAIAHLRAGDCARALAELDLAAAASPPRADLHVLRGETLLLLQRTEAARAAFEAALAVDPDRARAHAALGRIHLAEGRAHAARRALQRAAQLEPDDGVHHAMLAAAEASAGDLAAAAAHVAVARRHPATAPLLQELLRVHPALAAPTEAR